MQQDPPAFCATAASWKRGAIQRRVSISSLPANQSQHLLSLLVGLRNLRAKADRSTNALPPAPAGEHAMHGLTRNQTSAGWKCKWEFGIARCALLFLPRGAAMGTEAGAAVRWAEALGSGFHYAAFNPAGLDGANVLMRVTPEPGTINMDKDWHAELDLTLWLREGRVQSAWSGSDARGIWFDRYTLLAMYNRATATRTASGQLEITAVTMFARNVSAPPQEQREVELRVSGMPIRSWEKNWVPFSHDGRLYVQYSLAPEHVVLACDLASGNCTREHATDTTTLWARVTDYTFGASRSRGPRLSAPPLLVQGRLISVGHVNSVHHVYVHFFFEMEPQPPFALLRVSRLFRFFSSSRSDRTPGPATSHTADVMDTAESHLGKRTVASIARQRYHPVQYVAGMHLKEERVVLTYGVADGGPMSTSISTQKIFEMLEDRADGTHQYASCLAEKRRACDDATCLEHNPAFVDGPALVICSTMCSRYQFECDAAVDVLYDVKRRLKFSRARQQVSGQPLGPSSQVTTRSRLSHTISRLEVAAMMGGIGYVYASSTPPV